MKLYIIGNGFDRGHDLPTAYWDFRTFLNNVYPDFLCSFEEHYEIYPTTDDNSKKSLLWNELETNLANIDEDVIISQAKGVKLGLESGDIGIRDTLYFYFSEEYNYIQKLAKYIKQWVRSIRIRDAKPRTTQIHPDNDALYITFNYTSVLETVYKIPICQVIHIHGSLKKYDTDPVLGHGNRDRIDHINKLRLDADQLFDENRSSICAVVENYYRSTFKDVSKYSHKLWQLAEKDIDEIIVIGHSLAGVDMPYFDDIDCFTKKCATWTVYYFDCCEIEPIKARLLIVWSRFCSYQYGTIKSVLRCDRKTIHYLILSSQM